MPSEWHDTVGELIEERPELAVEILRDLMHVDLPPGVPASTASEVFNTRPSQDLVADKVVLAGTAHDVMHAIVVEAQRERLPAKLRQLPRYAMALWLRHECPVDVLVICPDKATAEYYAEPIPIPVPVPHRVFLPRALFPGQVPAFTTPEEVTAHPALAVLSVAYHGRDPAVAEAFVEGMGSLGGKRGLKYYEYGVSMSPRAVCEILEAMVTSTGWRPVHSEVGKRFWAEGRAEGRAEGERNTVLMVLKARGLRPTEREQQMIADCTDLDQLQKWAEAAVTATTTSEVFE
jgi:hypothetical protein